MHACAFERDREQVAQINITPLVDVMLVLLVIFMIAAPALSHTITLDSPGPAPDRIEADPPPPIALRIDAAGTVYWNGDATALTALHALLEAEVVRDPQQRPLLQIEASDDADYGVVAKVLAVARNAQIERIGFVKN